MTEKITQLKAELSKAVIGQERMIEGLLIGLLCEGHILIEGVPGLAKTTTINALAKALGLDFKRIQFTPDLLPSDIIGAQIYNPKDHSFSIKKGPLFTNLLLADEINRAPAKVQSALLEVMQEHQVTIGDETFPLERPFLVMATQNPKALESIHIDPELEHYIVSLVAATRKPEKFSLENIAADIMYGVSPRASIDLYKAARAKAFLRGNDYVTPADIGYIIADVLRHRIVLSYEARAQGIQPDEIIAKIVETVPVP